MCFALFSLQRWPPLIAFAPTEYAQVVKMLGNGRLEALCFDGQKRLCHIRGKLRKKVTIIEIIEIIEPFDVFSSDFHSMGYHSISFRSIGYQWFP